MRREILDRFGEDKLYGGGLSVRTTLDPRLQRLARTALVDGFVAYDHRHAGWRGPVKQIDIKGDWGKTLGAMPVWCDIEPGGLPSCSRSPRTAPRSEFVPAAPRPASLEKERETGVIPYRGSEMGAAEGRRAVSAERRVR